MKEESFVLDVVDSTNFVGMKSVTLSGELVVGNIERIYHLLQDVVSKYDRLEIIVDSPDMIDLSIVQLLVSISNYGNKNNKKIFFKQILDDEMKSLVKIGGAEYLFEKNSN